MDTVGGVDSSGRQHRGSLDSFDDDNSITTLSKLKARAKAPMSPFRANPNGREYLKSPIMAPAFMDDVDTKSIQQTSMRREVVESKGPNWSQKPAGKPTHANARSKPSATASGPETASTNGHKGEGVRPELRTRFEEAATSPCAEQPKYALGMASSVVFKMPKEVDHNGEPSFVAAAYSRHLGGGEPPKPSNPGPVAMVSDRSPDAVMERRRRRHMHGLLTSGRGKAFNRQILPDSLSEYGQERVILNKLIGGTHPSGDLQDIGPPRVKLWLNPRDNDHISYVKADPRYGRRAPTNDDVGSYDTDISVLRPRTVGYSPGHVRTIAKRNIPGRHTAFSSRDHGLSQTSASRLSDSASDIHGMPQESRQPTPSSTSLRLEYTHALRNEATARTQRQQQRREELIEAKKHAALSSEVAEGIGSFEFQLAELKAKGWKGV